MERLEEEASLPAGYVSLAQLQERWLKKQQEKKLNEDRRKSEAERRNRQDQRRIGGGKGRRNGGGMALIDDKGKGKEIVITSIGNGDKKKKKKKKNERSAKDRIQIKESDGGNGSEGVEIVDGRSKGIKELASVCMVEVLPTNGVKGGLPDAKINGDNRGRLNELKQSEGRLGFGRGYGRQRRENWGNNGDNEERYYRVKESQNGVSKGNEVGLESEKKTEDGILEDFNKKCGLTGGYRNVKRERNKINGEGLSNDGVAPEKKVSDEVLVVESAKNDEKGAVRWGYNRYRNWSGNGGEQRRYTSFGRSNYLPKMRQIEGRKIWVEKEKIRGNAAGEVGHSGTSN